MKRKLILFCLFGACSSLGWAGSKPGSDAYQLYLRAMVEDSQGNTSAAQDLLEKAIKLSPDSAYLEKATAELFFRRSDFQNAVDHIEKSLSLDNKNVKSYILAGQIYWGLGNQEKAESHFNQALKLAPDESEALVNLALSVTPKNPKKAIQLYTDYLSRHPGEIEIQERLAQLYSSLGDIVKAKDAWNKVLEASPDSIRAHLASAQLAEVEHDTTTAISHYEAVLEQDTNNLPLLLRVGELRYRNDQMAKAYDAFSKAQEIAPNSASANFWLALLAENRGDWPEAIRLLKTVADKAPEPGVLLRLSYYYTQSGQQKEAIAVLKKLSDNDPENTDFLRYLSVAYDQDKQYAKAVDVVQRLIAIDTENPDPYFRLGTLYDRMDKFKPAETALKKAIQLDPEFHMAINYLGYSYADRNTNLDEAEKLVGQALAEDPENGAYLDSMGWVYFRQKRFKQAEDMLLKATSVGTDPLIWDHLGDAQNENQKYFNAALSYSTSLRMNRQSKSPESKLKKMISRLSIDEKSRLFLSVNRDDFRALGLLRGLAKVEACRGSFCADVQSQVRYDAEGDLKFEIAGPLSVPVFLVTVSSSSECHVGIMDPNFQETKELIRSGMETLNSIWRGSLFDLTLKDSSPAKIQGNYLEKESSAGRLRFDLRTRRLKDIVKDGKKMTVLKEYKEAGSFFPLVYQYEDLATKNIFRITLIRPVTSGRYIGSAEQQ